MFALLKYKVLPIYRKLCKSIQWDLTDIIWSISRPNHHFSKCFLKLVCTHLIVLLRCHLLKLSFFAPITPIVCHTWFYLNATSPAAMNTEQMIITKILFIEGFESSHDKEARLQVYRLNRSANSRLLWMKKLNVHIIYRVKSYWKFLLSCINMNLFHPLFHV